MTITGGGDTWATPHLLRVFFRSAPAFGLRFAKSRKALIEKDLNQVVYAAPLRGYR